MEGVAGPYSRSRSAGTWLVTCRIAASRDQRANWVMSRQANVSQQLRLQAAAGQFVGPFGRDGFVAGDRMCASCPAAGVAVRSGHHCTQPLHRHLGINASARASLYIYSTRDDVDRFVTELRAAVQFFRDAGL